MVNVKQAGESIGKLTLMRFFPQEPLARAALVEEVCRMATTNEQIDWLARRAITLYNDWPGMREIRALFCSRWKPADGIEARSTVFTGDEGIPPETPWPAPRLTPGREEARQLLASVADEQPATAPRPKPKRTPPPLPEDKRITPEMVQRVCSHERLNEDGICRRCGIDCRRG